MDDEHMCTCSLNAKQESTMRIEDLFDSSRMPEKKNLYKIVLYFPFGVLLLCIRLIVGVAALFLLMLLPWDSYTRSIVLKGVNKVLGLVVEIDDKYLDENVKILVANHVSILDRLAVNFILPCKTVSNNLKSISVVTFWKDNDVKRYKEDILTEDIYVLQKYIEGSTAPLIYFPEGATTNGKVGLLKFSPSLFSLKLPIQPVLIHNSVSSFVDVSTSVLGSNVAFDIFWLFFLPCTFFKLKVLPVMLKAPEETAMDFSKRVQNTMASALCLIPTVYTCEDKFELLKRLKIVNSVSGDSPTKQNSSLGHRPIASQTLKEIPDLQCSRLNTAAKTFAKSPKERMLSYQERRTVLIESAKIRYLQKHGN